MTEPKHDPKLIEAMAIAISDGFWEGDHRGGQTWAATPEYQRVQFRIMARRAIQAAKLFKAERAKPAPHRSEREAA